MDTHFSTIGYKVEALKVPSADLPVMVAAVSIRPDETDWDDLDFLLRVNCRKY